MTHETLKLPSSIKKYGKVEKYPPEQPIRYDEVLIRAVVKPLHLGHHAVRDGRGKSVSVESGKGKKLKRPLPEETPVVVLTDMRDPDVQSSETIRLSAPFADWKVGGKETNINLRDHRISPDLKKRVRNSRRSGPKIIG